MLLVITWLLTPFMMTLGTESPTICCPLTGELVDGVSDTFDIHGMPKTWPNAVMNFMMGY